MNHFERFDLTPFLIDALNRNQLSNPTEIQERLIPSLLNGKSAIGQSQTGTGKTLAFALPLLTRIDPNQEVCQAVVTAPTRELADQLYQVIISLLPEGDHPYRVRKVVGGTDRKRLMTRLKNVPHVVVGTPGRISDIVKEQALDIRRCQSMQGGRRLLRQRFPRSENH